MQLTLPPIYHSRELLAAWTKRSIRARYQQSLLGWLWAIVQPVASVAIFSIIFTRFVPVDTGSIPYPVFSYVAVAPWTLFSTSLNDMTVSLVYNMALVTKVHFPREILPVAAMLARLLDFAVSAAVMFLLIFFYQVPVFGPGLLFFPLIVLVQLILILGIGLFAAAANVFFRDVQPLLALTVQVWFYASPIIYPVTMVPEQYRFIYFLNPMAGIIDSYRKVLLQQSLPDQSLLISAVGAVIILILGYQFFKRVEYSFADII
jgi:lipopolysaccharide transport system permease protein